MTNRQRTIYLYILSYYNNNGYAPTITDICKGCYTNSRQYIRECLWMFERMGLIEVVDGKHRAIKIIQNQTLQV